MAVRLGIPDSVAGVPLSRRLAWLTGTRLLFLFVLLALIGFFFLRRGLGISSFTVRAALMVLTISFGLAGIYAGVLRSGRRLTERSTPSSCSTSSRGPPSSTSRVEPPAGRPRSMV